MVASEYSSLGEPTEATTRGHVEVSIKMEIKPTDKGSASSGEVERVGEGHVRLVLSDQNLLDINPLKQGLLRTIYPALRDALAQHLDAAVKKSHGKMPRAKAAR